jgi:hypothetical protein
LPPLLLLSKSSSQPAIAPRCWIGLKAEASRAPLGDPICKQAEI